MIPAGLTDKKIEFLAKDGKLFSIQDGTRYEFPNMPLDHLAFLRDTLLDDEEAQKTFEPFDINILENLKQYGVCRFGACNDTPDSSEYGECIDHHEYFDCGKRGECQWEGKRCKEMKAEYGVLTPHMIKLIALIGSGLLNKEIADKMKISENTVANHIATIVSRIGGRNRVDIASFAFNRGIIK